jgi:hypothetical protein
MATRGKSGAGSVYQLQGGDPWGRQLPALRRRNVQLWQQNTHTGRLTGAMLDRVFLRARELLEEDPQTR